MRQEVTVLFDHDREVVLPVHDGTEMSPDAARRWLDQQFLANECEPLRATGKVLTADKVLKLAETVGAKRFESDRSWAADYARASLAALGRPTIRVDVHNMVVTY